MQTTLNGRVLANALQLRSNRMGNWLTIHCTWVLQQISLQIPLLGLSLASFVCASVLTNENRSLKASLKTQISHAILDRLRHLGASCLPLKETASRGEESY